jgi:hypothetical protein
MNAVPNAKIVSRSILTSPLPRLARIHAPTMIGTIAASAVALGSSPRVTAASTTPNSGVRVMSGAVREAPIRIWLMFRNSQPSTKWMIPAMANSAIASPLASPSWVRSSDRRLARTSTAVAANSWRNVETHGSSMPRIARLLRL